MAIVRGNSQVRIQHIQKFVYAEIHDISNEKIDDKPHERHTNPQRARGKCKNDSTQSP